jgi:hypothetical protein
MRIRFVYLSTASAFLFGYWDNSSTLLSLTLNVCFWHKADIHMVLRLTITYS